MQWYKEDINNYTGISSRCVSLNDPEGMQKFIQPLSGRVLNINNEIINSDSTSIVMWDSNNKELLIYKEIADDLYKNIYRIKIDTDSAPYITCVESVIAQGCFTNEDGAPIKEANLIGLEITIGEIQNQDYIDDLSIFKDRDSFEISEMFWRADYAIEKLEPKDEYLSI